MKDYKKLTVILMAFCLIAAVGFVSILAGAKIEKTRNFASNVFWTSSLLVLFRKEEKE